MSSSSAAASRALHAVPDARAGPHRARLRGGQRSRRHVVLEPLPRLPLRHREPRVLVLLLAGAGAGLALARPLRHAAADPRVHRARGGPLRPAQGRDAQHPGAHGQLRQRRQPVDRHHGQGRERECALHRHGHRQPVDAARAGVSGPLELQGRLVPHRPVAARGRRLHRPAGRRIIGTGSSGVQSIPYIAEQAKHLYVFQRTANYILPARNEPMDPERGAHPQGRVTASAARLPTTRPSASPATRRRVKSALDATPEERDAAYAAKWEIGGSISFLFAYNDLLLNESSNDTAAEFVRAAHSRHGEGPGDGRAALPDRPPDRHQAPDPRHRLLRDVQPRQRHAGGCTHAPDRVHHPDGPADH